MRKNKSRIQKGIAVTVFLTMLIATISTGRTVQAEEIVDIFNEAENGSVLTMSGEDTQIFSEETDMMMEDAGPGMSGSYTVPDGWSEDTDAGTSEKKVYKLNASVGVPDVSTISCSYIDTNYSVLEYEQLRDMLTNNLVYSNINAQISTSAVYTLAKDYLYILIVDDSAQNYRDIYHYVVGDYRCFCVEVHEYRSEAEQAKAQDQKSPQEIGQKIAEEFTWDSQW